LTSSFNACENLVFNVFLFLWFWFIFFHFGVSTKYVWYYIMALWIQNPHLREITLLKVLVACKTGFLLANVVSFRLCGSPRKLKYWDAINSSGQGWGAPVRHAYTSQYWRKCWESGIA
jgi:hypothetical protein